MRIIECEQGSDEWRLARCGKITASRIPDVVAQGKGGKPSATRAKYVTELALERIKKTPTDGGFTSLHIRNGIAREPMAADLYEWRSGLVVRTVGLVLHPTMDFAAASPDRLVGEDGLAQFKCPLDATHAESISTGKVDGSYIKQMQFEMACTSRSWCDFVSFHPDFPNEQQLFVKRFIRDPMAIVAMETEIKAFNADVEAMVAALSRYRCEFPDAVAA